MAVFEFCSVPAPFIDDRLLHISLRLFVMLIPSGRMAYANPQRRKVVQKGLQLLSLPFRRETVFLTFYSVASKPFRNTLRRDDQTRGGKIILDRSFLRSL